MAEYSPMMQHYLATKNEYKDCILFYRLGDFYEMFFEDAIIVSKELELTLTGKDCGQEERAPMCGVPFHAAETYINRLVAAGHKVAICEQMEDPKKAKGIVKREVIKVVIPMDQLFQPNDTLLWDRAELILRPFVKYVENPDYYHILLAAYTDDTGSDAYTRRLSESRARAVAGWLQEHGGVSDYIVPYGMGNSNPIMPNTSDANRTENRRMEIYLVPGEALLKLAGKGKITY